MKFLKLFSIVALSVVSLNMFAATKATITIKANDAAFSDVITIVEDATAPTDMSANNDIMPKSLGASPVSVNVWAEQNSVKYPTAILPNLEGLVIKFKANAMNTAYTMSFSNVEGAGYFLQQEGEDELIPMTIDYGFTCAVNAEITFTVVKAPETPFYPREVANGSWGTICYPELITSVEGAVVYELAGRNADATQIAVKEVAVANMVAGKPYLFQATAAAQKFFYDPEVTATLQEGACGLTGTFEQTTLVTDGFYVVKGQSFIPALGSSTVLANRAYLAMTDIATEMSEYPQQDGAPVRFFSVVRGAATEDMQVAADGVKDGAYLVNGHLVIVKDGKTYSAQGF